jgi:hypothetical protein
MKFCSIACAAAAFSSTNTAEAAPRLSARSRARAPGKEIEHARRSRARRDLKMAAFTRSIVGRTSVSGTANRMPPATGDHS